MIQFVRKSLVLASLLMVSGSAFAQAPVSEIDLDHGIQVKYVAPSGLQAELYGCIGSGNEAIGNAFAAKYPANEIWIDQITPGSTSGGLSYTARASASINGQWVHQFFQMKTTFTHSCDAGTPVLTGESRD